MNRRNFLAATGGAALAQKPSFTFVDCHIHLFDPSRPQGVPWPPKGNSVLFKPALPQRYASIAKPIGMRGAIAVECSPWVEDNRWLLDTAAKSPLIIGVIGNIVPGTPAFRRELDSFRSHPLFRGIRYGNLWDRNLSAEISNPDFIRDMRYLASLNLTLDSANPNPDLIRALLRLTDRVPDLKLVVDHLPQMRPYGGDADLRELAQRSRVWAKISEVLRRVEGAVPTGVAFYRPRLDQLFHLFGEDRLLFGSDWPNSDQWATFATGLGIVREYFAAKSAAAESKCFRTNYRNAYGLA